MVELNRSAEGPFKVAADKALREIAFDPAVEAMQYEFENHPVTREIKAGIGADNKEYTNSLDAPFAAAPRGSRKRMETDYSPPNLFSFIGFEKGSNPLAAIESRLTPANRDSGPRLVYKGHNADSSIYYWEVRAPSEEAIYNSTPMPWASGISWAKRIEQGIPGIGYYLNALNRKGSRSGGGIQIDEKLRAGRFRATSYLTQIFKNFLARVQRGS